MNKNNSLYITNLPETLEGKYNILYPISHSDKTSVYLLEKKTGDHKAVIKVIYADSNSKKLAEMLPCLTCDYILKPLEYYVKENIIYVLYDYYTPLTELLVNETISLKEILCIGIDLCKALLYLHENNIMHFDVSAGNIFQAEDGHYLLGDYSNAVIFSSMKDKINDGLEAQTDICVCDCRSLVTFLLTLLNRGEMTASVLPSMERELPEKLLFVLSISDINFNNENEILERLCDDLQTLTDFEEILNSAYSIKIGSKRHELIAKKTVPIEVLDIAKKRQDKIKNKSKNISKNNNIIKNIGKNKSEIISKYAPYIALLFCGLVFIFSFYNFVVKDKNIKSNIVNVSEKYGQTKQEYEYKVCDISDMGIKSFPDDIYTMNLNKYKNLSDISALYAYSNVITSLTGVDRCGDIRELYLSDNKLSDLKDVKKLETMEVLVLSYNNVRDVTGLAKLQSLVFLDLSGNYGLENIQSLSELSNLQILVLTNTGISKEEIKLLQQSLPDCEIIG